MDITGHILLGVAVSGQVTPYTLLLSVLPDIGSVPLQINKSWKNPTSFQLRFYKFFHSPLFLTLCYFLPDPAFLIVASHIVSDMVTHKEPYSDFPLFQWNYNNAWYYVIILILVIICAIRLF